MHDRIMHDACMHDRITHDACVHDRVMHDACMRDRIMHMQIIGAVSAGSMAPKILAETLHLFASEKRTAAFVIVPLPPTAEIRDPDPATLAEFHKKYAARCTAPPTKTARR